MGTGWGINSACDVDSACAPICNVCMDCHNPDCQCGLPEGMKNCAMFPAEMLIDYVRIYQDKEDPLHTIGCSPPNFPTEGYIEGNPGKYINWDPYYGFNKPIDHSDDEFVGTEIVKSSGIIFISVCIICTLIAGYLYHQKSFDSPRRQQYIELPVVN